MVKYFPICATFIAFTACAANAQQREATLQKVEVPGSNFEIILAMPTPGGITYDLAESPDALMVHLIGGKLAVGFGSADAMLQTAEELRAPGCDLKARSNVNRSDIPVALYLVSKGE